MMLPAGPSSDLSASAPPAPATAPDQPGNPLHGVKLETIVSALAAHYGWDELGQRISIRCFTSEPSVASSLKFLREIRRNSPTVHNFPPPKP